MSSALQHRPNLEVASFMTREKIELVKQTICKGASDTELALFIDVCNRTKLDPFARQIYAVPRWDATQKKNTYAFQISIDGFRLIAERSGKYLGQTEPEYCDEKGNWSPIWLKDDPPFAARVGVYRMGFNQPIYGLAKYKNYVQTKQDGKPMAMWAKMPDHMLAKCAEALALRKAFPQDLSGLYTDDELQIEKQIQGEVIERTYAPEKGISKTSAADEIRGYIEALANLNISPYTDLKTPAQRRNNILQTARNLNTERAWGYGEIKEFSELTEKHTGDVVGWYEGELRGAQEAALDKQDDEIM